MAKQSNPPSKTVRRSNEKAGKSNTTGRLVFNRSGTGKMFPTGGRARKGEKSLMRPARTPEGRWKMVSIFDTVGIDQRIGAIRHGYPANLVSETAQLFEINKGDICKILALSSATLSRKVVSDDNLPADVSERLDRLYEITATAARVLGSERNARTWITTPNQSLGGKAPYEMIGTGIEGDQVKAVLSAIEYGGVA